MTQPEVSSEVVWGGRPRRRGGPCLRDRQRDEDSRAVQGDRPTNRRQREWLSERDTKMA